MKSQKKIFLINFIILSLTIVATTNLASATTSYPYSVNIGDKIDYHVDILENGTNKGPINIFGLNLTQGDNFQMQIFTGKAQSTNYAGSDFTIKFLKGDKASVEIPGSGYLYTSNKTFWSTYKNISLDIGNEVYKLTQTNNSISYSWTLNADNFVSIQFDPTNGLVNSYERMTTSGPYNYTHIKFVNGSSSSLFNDVPLLSNVPGFEVSSLLISVFFIVLVSILIRKKKK